MGLSFDLGSSSAGVRKRSWVRGEDFFLLIRESDRCPIEHILHIILLVDARRCDCWTNTSKPPS